MKKISFIFGLFLAMGGCFHQPVFAQFTSVQEQKLFQKDYVENGGFESGVAKWTRYKDAAQAAPVDCTGGSPTGTLTAPTANPITGKASGLISKPASNVQGEGYALAFTIDKAAKTRVLTISGSYEIASGTYSPGSTSTDSDLTFYVYDVDGASVIQPAGYKVDGFQSNNTYQFSATFQAPQFATDTRSLRLCVHHATNSASAFTFKLDEIKVGVQNKSQGPPVTDWRDYTPTIGTTGGSVTALGKWRRVGDMMEVSVDVTWPTVFTGGSPSISLPSGFSIDLQKIPGTATGSQHKFGMARLIDVGTENVPAEVLYLTTTTVAVRSLADDRAGATGFVGDEGVNPTSPFNWANNDRMVANFSVPIVGWGSTVTMSDNADTRVVGFRAYRNTNQTGVNTNNSFVKIAYDTITSDTHGTFNTSTNQWSVPVSGYYQCMGAVQIASTNVIANTISVLGLFKNSNQIDQGSYYQIPIASQVFGVGISTAPIQLVAGDLLELRIYGNGNNSASTLTASGGAASTWFGCNKVSGPSQIAASETVAATYYLSGNQTTSVQINFDTREIDTHGAVTTGVGAWKFTAPVSGIYQVSANVLYNGTATLLLYKNNSSYKFFAHSNGTTPTRGVGSTILRLNAGDYIDLRPGSSQTVTGGALNAGDTAIISIVKVGN